MRDSVNTWRLDVIRKMCKHAEVEGLKRKLAASLAPEQASLKPSWRVRSRSHGARVCV